MASGTGQEQTSTGSATLRHFTDMQERVAEQELEAGTADRELAGMKQRLIVDGASKVLFERGFHGTSIRDIAAACDMSMGQLYHYISSKDDILYLMHRHSQEMWHEHLAEAGFEEMADPVAKLEQGLRISIQYLSDNRDLIQFLYTETKYLDEQHLRLALDLDDQNVVGFYRHLLTEIPGAPGPDQADLAANLLAFICVFLSLRGWNLHLSSKADVDAAIDYLVDFIFRGLGIERGTTAQEAPA
jgi:AcrR family transcriptional regulator